MANSFSRSNLSTHYQLKDSFEMAVLWSYGKISYILGFGLNKNSRIASKEVREEL